MQAAAKTADACLCAKRDEGIVGGIEAGGHDDAAELPRSQDALQLAGEHGLAEDRLEHLPRKPGGRHSGLEYR